MMLEYDDKLSLERIILKSDEITFLWLSYYYYGEVVVDLWSFKA